MKTHRRGTRGAFSATALVCVAIVAAPTLARAQTSYSYTDGGIHSPPAVPNPIVIGDTAPNNSLTISNSTDVTTGSAIFGYGAAAGNNTALITGGSSLTLTDTVNNSLALEPGITFGRLGGNNSLTINGASTLSARDLYMGRSGASNNTFVIDGNGTTVTFDRNLVVGTNSSFDHLTVSGGADLIVATAFTGAEFDVGLAVGANNNSALVTGAGTTVSHNGILFIGPGSSGNSMTVAAGAVVNTRNSMVGFGATGVNNTLTVTGAGSQYNLTTSGEFNVGGLGTGNRLNVLDGAIATASQLYIGRFQGSTSGDNNSVVVSGTNSQITVTGPMDVGTFGKGNSLSISSGGAVVVSSEVRIGGYLGTDNNVATVDGTGSQWNVASNIVIGAGDTAGTGTSLNNQLHITNGGSVTSTQLLIGRGATSSGTLLLADGTYSGTSNFIVRMNAGAQGAVVGWGTASGTQLQNNGRVVADGEGVDRTLSMTGFTSVTNNFDNTTDNGWFARNHGKLTLPAVSISPGTPTNWGESTADTTIDLVNSVRLSLSAGGAGGNQSIALLARDRADVPAFSHSQGHRLSTVWDFGGTLDDVIGGGSVDLVFRYDEGIYEHDLQLYRYDGSAWVLETTALQDSLNDLISLSGVTSATAGVLYATAVPEAGTCTMLLAGVLAIIGGRRRLRG